MRNFLENSFKEKLIIKSDEILRHTPNAEYIRKVLAVQAALKGARTNEIANCFQVTERTVQIWVKRTLEKGFESALTRVKGSGRPKKLSERQLECVENWVGEDGPSYFGIDAHIWTGDLLSRVIQSEFNVKLSSKWCSNFISEYKKRSSFCTDEYLAKRYSQAQKDKIELEKLRKKNKELRKENKQLKKQLKS